MSHVALFLLGPPRIERDGQPVEVDTRKAIALAAYLTVTGESHSRDALAALFWPLSDQARARAALRRTLTPLRRSVGDGKLEVDGERLALRPGVDLSLDVEQYLGLMARCETHGHAPENACPACLAPLSQAVNLYRADFMAGFTLRDSPGFDEWQTFQTESLRLELIWALERLIRCYSDAQEFDSAIGHARRWAALDPIHEVPHYLLMQLYAWSGQRSNAFRQYEEYVQIMARELDEPPDDEIAQLYQDLRKRQAPRAPQRPVPAHAHNLPLQPTPFVGRQDELEEIGHLLDDTTCRMVTLFGPGGIGKTRLGLELAAQRLDRFAHGVFFVPLAQLSSVDLLVPAIAEALSFSFRGSADPKEQLLNFLREKQVLLILDNFEHLLAPPRSPPEGVMRGEDSDGPGLVAEILSRVPGVKILLTSRERLNLRWEWPFAIEGLQFPPSGETARPEAYSAVQLFHQSARRAHPGFKLSEAEKPSVVHICQSLRGMPLGIELAAAWVEVSTCQEIAQELQRNLDFLATSLRDVPERHRSLQAAFAHSWDLLSIEERSVLSQLSVFRNGFGRQAAQAVTGASLMHLSALMHKSVLRKSPTGRYEMLEVLRQYADEKLQQSPQTHDETYNRHCTFYAEYLYQRQDHLMGKEQHRILDEIGIEIDNARVAWRWAVEHEMWEQIDKSLNSLYRFFETRSWFREGEEALGQAALTLAANTTGQTEALLARVLARQGWLCLKLSRFDEGRELLQSSLATFQRLDVPDETALTLSRLGVARAWLREFDAAAQLFEESIMISSTNDDHNGLARGLNNIGIVAMILKRHTEAKLILQESLTIAEENSNLSNMLDSLTTLGHVAEALGETQEAKGYHQQAYSVYSELGDRWNMANSLCSLGFVRIALGENGQARQCFQESLETAQDLQAVDLILENLIGLAKLLSEDGNKEQALELVACVLEHSAIAGQAKERAEELLSELEPLLVPQAFAAARERGKRNDIQHYVRAYGVGQPMI